MWQLLKNSERLTPRRIWECIWMSALSIGIAFALVIGYAYVMGSPAKAAEMHDHGGGPIVTQADISKLEHCFDVNNPRFSTFGWCHKELHELGFIEEVISQTKDWCCGGPTSGECRVSLVDMVNRKALVDHKWMPMDNLTPYNDRAMNETKSAVLYELKPGFAVVCATHHVWCVGVPGGN